VQLSQAELTQQNQQTYFISGVLDFSTVPDLMQSAMGFFKSYKKSADSKTDARVLVDLSKVTRCNSAGLALMLEMGKQAGSENIKLYFKNLPETLLIIAKAYGIEEQIIAPP